MRYLLALLLMVTGCRAASPSFSSFNTNQFSTNNLFISIKDGASVTNIYNTRVNPSLPNSVAVLGDLLWRDVASIATLTNSMEGAEISHNVANGDDSSVYFDLFATIDGTFNDFSDIYMIANTNSTQISLTTDAGGVLKSSLRLNSGDGSGFIELKTNGTNEFYVANGSGYTGAGTLFLSDDGTYKAAGGTTINPSNDYIPVRSGATTFADSGLYRVGVTNVALDSQIIFGPGTTNVMYRSGGSLVITNQAARLEIVGSTASGYLGTGTGAFDVSAINGGLILGNATRSVVFDGAQILPNQADIDIGGDGAEFQDLWVSRNAYVVQNVVWNGPTNNLHDTWGLATPEGATAARPGSIHRDTGADIGIVRVKTSGVGNTGWQPVHVGNQAYLAANATAVDATMANLSLSVGVINGKKYSFKLVIFLANSTPTDGAIFDFDGGSATANNFRVHGTAFGSALSGSAQSSALATDHTVTTVTGDNMMEFNGSFEPSASGTFIPRFAENVDAGGTLTVYRGSNLILTEIP